MGLYHLAKESVFSMGLHNDSVNNKHAIQHQPLGDWAATITMEAGNRVSSTEACLM